MSAARLFVAQCDRSICVEHNTKVENHCSAMYRMVARRLLLLANRKYVDIMHNRFGLGLYKMLNNYRLLLFPLHVGSKHCTRIHQFRLPLLLTCTCTLYIVLYVFRTRYKRTMSRIFIKTSKVCQATFIDFNATNSTDDNE